MNRTHSSRKHNGEHSKLIETEPYAGQWQSLAVGAVVPLGMAAAAVIATIRTRSEHVAVTAWITAAVVGTASVVSAATVSRRRTKQVDGANERERAHVPSPSSR